MELSHYGVQKPVHNPKEYVKTHAWIRLLGEKKYWADLLTKADKNQCDLNRYNYNRDRSSIICKTTVISRLCFILGKARCKS